MSARKVFTRDVPPSPALPSEMVMSAGDVESAISASRYREQAAKSGDAEKVLMMEAVAGRILFRLMGCK
jgi:hypothetical protein